MQERLDKLEHDYENLIEQIRPANQQKFGRSTEKLSEIAGQLSFFNEPTCHSSFLLCLQYYCSRKTIHRRISQRLLFVILPPFLALFQAVTELGNIEFSRSVFVFWKAYMPFLFPSCSIKICPSGINIYVKKG